ncbi:hypothetical protein EDD16DRAFT_1527955 [Pisolithus croceorrhizus]|nr:hypothetical protein EDD16DRAFT_1527955 [Pisolithus croceorrhizus]KAI6166416.1 hypothetical protein EDD17DRAFT_1505316 [Pisolithus thermaeus]
MWEATCPFPIIMGIAMLNHGWMTPDQLTWLMEKLPKYQEISKVKNYSLFWPCTFGSTVNNVILACKHKICNWFRWHMNASWTNCSLQKQKSILVGLADLKKRQALTQSEIYSKNYYSK